MSKKNVENKKAQNKTVSKTKNKPKRKDATTSVLIGLSVVSLVMVMAVVGQFYMVDEKQATIENGTYINGYNISGMTTAEAQEYFSSAVLKSSQNFNLTLRNGDKSWTFTNKDFEVNSDVFSIVEMSKWHDKEVGSYPDQVKYLQNITKDGNNLSVAFNYIFTGLDEKINKVIEEVDVPATDSTITFSPDSQNMWVITDEVSGWEVDKIKLYNMINDAFKTTNQIDVEIPLVEVVPTVSRKYNEALTHKISQFSTNVSDSTGGRKSNVKLALSKFNGMRVDSGESVSFNRVTSPHSIANGYKVATIILNGSFVDGVGGGVCQASTTLYNALLTAGLQIDEVSKHTLPVKYVPLALDAMVSEMSDLKFTNNTPYPIFIRTHSDSNSVYVEIYSHPNDDGYTFKTRSVTLQNLKADGDIVRPDTKREYSDKVLFKGEYYRLSYAREGYEVESYLDTYKDGVLVKENKIRHEIYKPQKGVIIEGVEIPPANIVINDEYSQVKNQENVYLQREAESLIPVDLCP